MATKVFLWLSKGSRDSLAHLQRMQLPSTLSSARSDKRHPEMCLHKGDEEEKTKLDAIPGAFPSWLRQPCTRGEVQRGAVRAEGCPCAPQAAANRLKQSWDCRPAPGDLLRLNKGE